MCTAARTALRVSSAEAKLSSYVPSDYIAWLEMAGARVVPIRYNLAPSAVKALLAQVNGVLFTGGPAKPLEAPKPYFETATLLYEEAAKADIPLWGTCLGLQTISCIANGGVDVLSDTPLENFAYPLEFTKAATASRMFGDLSASGRSDFEANVTTNWHHYGVEPERLQHTSLVPLATNVALNGKRFVSALEGRGALQVYAVQFHPESNQFRAASGGVPSKSAAAIRTVQHLARVFVERVRNTSHAFPSAAAESAALVHNQGQLTQTDPTSLYPADGVYVFL